MPTGPWPTGREIPLELAAVALCLLALGFAAGFHLGREPCGRPVAQEARQQESQPAR